MEEKARKVLVIGNGYVGKTSFVCRVTEGRFISNYIQTVGVDYAIKKVRRPNDVTVTLALWDLAGQASFKSLMPVYARHASGVIIMCDVENRESFDQVVLWKDQIDSILLVRRPTILLINKFDLPTSKHRITLEEISELSKNHGFIRWYQTSVKNNINLQEALEDIADLILKYESEEEEVEDVSDVVPVGKTIPEEPAGCC